MDLMEQLSAAQRKLSTLGEEVLALRREVERLSALAERAGSEKDQLASDRSELTLRITSYERMIQQFNEVVWGILEHCNEVGS